MSSIGTPHHVPGMILTDAIEPKPILDFGAYSNTIVKMIKNSQPRFSIGIYGESGSGKSTLMKQVENKLNQNNDVDILTVWVNAWRYEGQEQFTLVSLMKTIAGKMDETPKYEKAKEMLFRSAATVSTIGKGVASKFLLTEKYLDELQKTLTPEMKA